MAPVRQSRGVEGGDPLARVPDVEVEVAAVARACAVARYRCAYGEMLSASQVPL
jgi:hypothetical protein